MKAGDGYAKGEVDDDDTHLGLRREEVVLLVVLLQEEEDVGKDDDGDGHAPVAALLQDGRALEHELPGGGEHVGLLELPALEVDGRLGVDPLVDVQEPLFPLLLRHPRVHVLEDLLRGRGDGRQTSATPSPLAAAAARAVAPAVTRQHLHQHQQPQKHQKQEQLREH